MYFDLSRKKFFTVFMVTAVLFGAVYLTMTTKYTYFGVMPFEQVFRYVAESNVRYLVYSLRSTGTDMLPASPASALSTLQAKDGNTTAAGIPVLTYHAIIDRKDTEVSPESFEGHNVSLRNFENQMFALKKAGWETITLEEFAAFIRGEKTLPEKSFLLTFDDGAKQSYYPVDPLLRVLNYEAVTFILPAHSKDGGSYYYLSEGEIKRMIGSRRWEIGSHGYDIHTFVDTDGEGTEGAALSNLMWLPEENRLEAQEEYSRRIGNDLTNSRDALQNMFGVPVRTFAFPFGDFGQLSKNNPVEAPNAINAATRETYDFAFYQHWPAEGFSYNYPHYTDLMVRRISVNPNWTGTDLLTFLERGMPKSLPYHDELQTDNGWRSSWGDYTFEQDEYLHFKAHPEEAGSAAILDGTGHWKDYIFTAEINSPSDTGALLYARYKDSTHNAACNFADDFIHIEEIIDGERRVIKGVRESDDMLPEGTFTVGVIVEGRNVACQVNGETVVSTSFLDPRLEFGGIGFKVWSAESGFAELNIESIDVSEYQEPTEETTEEI